MPYSNAVNPVALPPGCARLATNPAPTGSMTFANTIGALRLACCSAATLALAEARMTSGASPTNSAASVRRSASPAGQRVSIRTLRPSVQPNCRSPSRKAASRACSIGSRPAPPISTPMRRIRSGCCARAASGHAATVPLSSVMNSRRFIAAIIRSPRRRGRAGSAGLPSRVPWRF